MVSPQLNMVSRSHIVLASLSSRVSLATDSGLSSVITGGAVFSGSLHCPRLPDTAHFRMAICPSPPLSPLSPSSFPNFVFEKQSHQHNPFFLGHTGQIKYLKTLHLWHQSKGYQTSDRVGVGAASAAPVPGNHLPSNTVPSGQWTVLWKH